MAQTDDAPEHLGLNPPRPQKSVKRILKLLVSLGVYAFDLLREACSKSHGGACAVFYYHEVVEAERARFAAQLDTMLRVAQPVSAAATTQLERGKKYFAITVDDAFISFFQNGMPELQKRNISALVFVPTGWLGKKVDWAMEEVMASPNEHIATFSELNQFAKHPLIHFGSHTMNHRKLSELSDADALKELAESKEFLEREFGRTVDAVSFPYGGFTARDVKLASELGYKSFFSTAPKMTGQLGVGIIGRFRVDPSDWLLEVKLKAAGAYRWQSLAQRMKSRWHGTEMHSDARVSPACSA
jgi:peptidoglycan/xylan/chitin deacetylase (PgdA/CDA1 family)